MKRILTTKERAALKIGSAVERSGFTLTELMSRKASRDGSDDAYESLAIRQAQRWKHRKTGRVALVLHGPNDREGTSTVMYRYEAPAKKSKNTGGKSKFVSTCSVKVDKFRKTFERITP